VKSAAKHYLGHQEFEIWRPVLLGMYSDVHELLAALKSKRCHISAPAMQIMTGQDFTLTRYKSVDKLVITSARQLGLEGRVCYGEIFVEGVIRGLLPCPTEFGAQLRHQYENQPENELLRIISCSRFLDPYGRARVFALSQYKKTPHLDVYTATPDSEIGLDDRYVWIHPHI